MKAWLDWTILLQQMEFTSLLAVTVIKKEAHTLSLFDGIFFLGKNL